ncbi:Crp/Fnr family transcriptional regulator [Listeria seeligeri]|uniref:Cyclic nucleotide-binding protein n=1 Tax=Listeria seeligeri TaxID=1640 RepID=A0ABR5E952_LISSE|nr:Crp/Fnr family transcriptional regulator [Listeria seeligeri]KKD46948.1 cyclic nucleotide-binding protein [Listeria seeligeri]MBC1577515.1 Crp/Fnr family transcriptional regulator [Listeria seeligeri]MBC1580036.1 Crp/Fnr family transcriptional regulator [Listeria seeligeri]MBC1586869.1 Crp/Fnr family transcriptional regulator [Listeria seeligeri]MBC1592956.1 Crp/Fnr family transcriptional regulator [Listeria seeligeri]
MYSDEDIFKETTTKSLLQILKKNEGFHENCYQEIFPKGQEIKLNNTSGFKIYLVESGYFAYCLENEHGNSGIICFVGGEVAVNLVPIINEEPDNSILRTLTEIHCWVLEPEFVERVLSETGQKEKYLLANLLYTRRAYFKASKRTFMKKEARIRACLKDIGLYMGRVTKEREYVLPEEINNSILAQYANTTREYTNIIVLKLRKEGILDDSHKPWVIKNMNAL